MFLEIGRGGKMEPIPPKSLAGAVECVSLWAGDNDHATVGRLCAGALGVFLDSTKKLPKYNPLKEQPLEYGHRCLDRLLSAGIVPVRIYEEGAKCLAEMARLIPSEQEVSAAENFTPLADAAG